MRGLSWWIEQVTAQIIDNLLSPPPALGLSEEDQ